ncbi:hypothetical protein [Acaryochloris sp. 'Moss Beach']|uniref:hypothetical protein n=1 Tax=Acaryochloris sp. 'Moss Beach' TaxID=2740837 RepID=UPI001F277426|nr:hypothetical protein [Acaryochloris sp. 'Moss Beach']
MAKSSLSLALTASDPFEVKDQKKRLQPAFKKSLPWLLMGCISLPIKLPFPTPFDCKTPPTNPYDSSAAATAAASAPACA